jgi:RNA polymerase sigma-70 factor (ECF subfamily)
MGSVYSAGEAGWGDNLLAMTPVLHAFAWSLSHNMADADDLAQETLAKARSHGDRFVQGTKVRAQLFAILRNTFYSAVVRRRREVRDEDGAFTARLITPQSQDWSVSVEELRRARKQLPPTHREALVWVGGADITYEETAELCGCVIGTIKIRVSRARARMLTLMDGGTSGER